jgi:hypothetical protein
MGDKRDSGRNVIGAEGTFRADRGSEASNDGSSIGLWLNGSLTSRSSGVQVQDSQTGVLKPLKWTTT